MPWDTRVGRFICDVLDTNHNPHPLDPRGVLKKVATQAAEMGYVLEIRPELEWYFVYPPETRPTPSDNGKYMDTFTVFDTQSKLRFDIADDMTKMGIPVKTIHHECGPGQNEIELLAHEVVGQCDNTQTAKMIIKAHAHLKNLIGTLMPKPFLNQAGSGLHIHQILTKDGENVFAGEEHQVSDILRHYVGEF